MAKKALQILNEAKEYEEKSQHFEAAQKHQVALRELNKTSNNQNEKSFCKKKLREMNLIVSKKLEEFPFIVKSTKEEQKRIKSQINSLVDIEDISELLDKIGKKNSIFCPSFQEVNKQAKQTMPITWQSQSFIHISFNDNGDQLKDGHDPAVVNFYQNYSIFQDLAILDLRSVFDKLMAEKLNIQNLSDHFRSKSIFREDFLKILDVAIERFFNGDYISTMHILVPKFENVFFDLTQKLEENVDIIATRAQKGGNDELWTQDKTLGEDFLKNDEVRKVWGEDFCEQIIFVFFSQFGYKLRHKIAHGYSKSDELNFENSVLVLYFFLALAARIKKVEK